jgi:nucleotide-binding universal stress UspA family protein
MLCSRILIAYDGSALAKKAFDKAIELAKLDSKIEIEVMHVITHYELPEQY